MDPRWWAEVGQWREEIEARMEDEEIQRANELAAQERDEQFRADLEDKWPILRSW